MVPSRTIILKRLRGLNTYLAQYHVTQQSLRFEELVCQAVAGLLHVPYYDADTDDASQSYRLTWHGSAAKVSKASPGGPDGIARAHDFCIVIEVTQKTGTKQWSQEFGACLDHARAVAQAQQAGAGDPIIVLVTTMIHNDTYVAIKPHNEGGDLKIVPVEIDSLCTALETARLAFTIRHLDVRRLFSILLDCVSREDSPSSYRASALRRTQEWQRGVLELEKTAVVAIRSYRAMIKEGRRSVGLSDIFTRLSRDPIIKWYFGRVDSDLALKDISHSLLQESLGAVVGKLFDGEELFCPVPLIEFKSRCERRLEAVEQAHEAS
jgi:hypothetical protein